MATDVAKQIRKAARRKFTAEEKIRTLGKRAFSFTADVTKVEMVAELADMVMKDFLHIDILVNTAGVVIRKAALELTSDEWHQIINVNTIGTFLCCQAVGKVMIAQKRGKIINMSSIRGVMGTPGGAAAYGASKGAVDALTQTLALEWAQHIVHVNAIARSIVVTEMTKSMFDDPARAKALTSKVPLGRLAEVEHIIGSAIFLASKASDYITGQVIHVDGGMSAGIL
jgi:NAD(P)-dependent dehydrogenase (short-subunit alcohol dehydrogenase family)